MLFLCLILFKFPILLLLLFRSVLIFGLLYKLIPLSHQRSHVELRHQPFKPFLQSFFLQFHHGPFLLFEFSARFHSYKLRSNELRCLVLKLNEIVFHELPPCQASMSFFYKVVFDIVPLHELKITIMIVLAISGQKLRAFVHMLVAVEKHVLNEFVVVFGREITFEVFKLTTVLGLILDVRMF